ncbi:hypothetical protein RN001_000014 [Aquatica leii]|uniref:Uncharacterized protein n=1 Tax=Aquatica leii TaxID=1421715 RepID=A0AAN7QLS9_9COLE|nr:hypothetical protein RN001_000014 [Aquatica leii]
MRSSTSYFVLFICVAQVLCFYEIPDEVFDKHTLECMEKVKVDKTFIKDMLDEDFHVTKSHPKLIEQLECVAKSKSVINENGEFKRDVMYNEIFNNLLPFANKTEN